MTDRFHSVVTHEGYTARFGLVMPTNRTADARHFAQLAAALTLTGLLIAAVDYLAHAAFDALVEPKKREP